MDRPPVRKHQSICSLEVINATSHSPLSFAWLESSRAPTRLFLDSVLLLGYLPKQRQPLLSRESRLSPKNSTAWRIVHSTAKNCSTLLPLLLEVAWDVKCPTAEQCLHTGVKTAVPFCSVSPPTPTGTATNCKQKQNKQESRDTLKGRNSSPHHTHVPPSVHPPSGTPIAVTVC